MAAALGRVAAKKAERVWKGFMLHRGRWLAMGAKGRRPIGQCQPMALSPWAAGSGRRTEVTAIDRRMTREATNTGRHCLARLGEAGFEGQVTRSRRDARHHPSDRPQAAQGGEFAWVDGDQSIGGARAGVCVKRAKLGEGASPVEWWAAICDGA